MNALPASEHKKLVAILGLLGSDAVGERAAAGLKASEMLSRLGITWDELLPRPAAVVPFIQRPFEEVRPEPWAADDEKDHQRLARCLLSIGYNWPDFERDFLLNMCRWSNPSRKQLRFLEKLRAERFGSGRAAA